MLQLALNASLTSQSYCALADHLQMAAATGASLCIVRSLAPRAFIIRLFSSICCAQCPLLFCCNSVETQLFLTTRRLCTEDATAIP